MRAPPSVCSRCQATESDLRQAFAMRLIHCQPPNSQMTRSINAHITLFLSIHKVLPQRLQRVRQGLVLEALRVWRE
ncbi:hypothetical protein AAVH_08540 [Aphelenchoides avenae]|nr:hypothetical protein AAVH_08540 [Aphelenchus avenae]